MEPDDCGVELPYDDSSATCSRCGEQGLHWQEIITAHGYPALALFNAKNRKHVCPQSTELFNVVSE